MTAASVHAPDDRLGGFDVDPAFRDRYELLDRIGAGAFAQVFRARQRGTGQEVAIKFLKLDDGLKADPAGLQIARFRRELEVCSLLHHPNIVSLIDAGQGTARVFYAVFSHAPGNNLADHLTLKGCYPVDITLHLMAQVLDALACAHGSGVIHRDIKPDNVVISSTGARPNAMVLDFGLGVLTSTSGRWGSRLTLRGEFVGTPAYSPPEQLLGADPTPAADLYAWGITTIEALTGCRIMAGATLQETLHRQLSTDPVSIPPSLRDTDLGELLARVCEKDVSRRLGDAAMALEQLLRIDPRDIGPIVAGEDEKTPPRQSTPSRSTRKRPVFSVSLSRNPRFTGRETLLADIAGNLRASGLLAVCALKGMGGVGKTQLALEYAFRHADDYQVVAWLRAQDAGTLDADFARLAAALGLPEADAPEEHRRIDAAKAWLADHDRWLLIFDNAPDPRLIRPYLPRNDSGHVLITSRNQSWQGLARSVAVDVLRSDDATQLLLSRSGCEETESARRVAQLLGNLPLALEEAAAYVEASGKTLADYARLFVEHQTELLTQARPPADYPATLLTTWDLSLEQLRAEEPSAVELLNALAHLGSEEIPRFALASLGDTAASRGSSASAELLVDRQLGALRRYSLVRVDGEGIFVHRLLQAVVRDRLGAEGRATAAARALRLVERAFPGSGAYGRARPECTQLLPHAVTALSYARHVPSCRIDVGRLLTRTGVYLSAVGWSAEAVNHLERAVEIFSEAGPEFINELAQAADSLGMILYQLGRLEPAAERHAQAVGIFARGPHRDPARAAQASINLAWVRWSEGKLAAAEDAASSALEMLGPDSDAVNVRAIGALSILTRILYDRGRVDEARTRAEDADRRLRRLPAELHPLMCGPLLQVAQTLHSLGKPFDALEWAEKGLELGEGAYGKHHPLVAGTHCVLGQIHHRLGNFEHALAHFQEAVASAESAQAQVDQHVAVAACFSTAALLDLNRPEEARDAAAAAERLLSKTFGARRQMQGHVALARGRVDVFEARTDTALRHFEHASTAFSADGGKQHPALIEVFALHGDTGLARADEAGALAAYEAGLQVAQQHRLGDHPAVAALHLGLAEVYGRRGDDALARRHRERAREICETALAGPSAFPERILTTRLDALRRLESIA